MDTSRVLPVLGEDDPLFEIATYTQSMSAALDPDPYVALLTNGWLHFGSGYQPLTFQKMGRLVIVTGMIKGGTTTSGIAVANIPAGMAPPLHNNQTIGSAAGGNYASNTVAQFATDGTVKVFGIPGSLSYLMFNNSYTLPA